MTDDEYAELQKASLEQFELNKNKILILTHVVEGMMDQMGPPHGVRMSIGIHIYLNSLCEQADKDFEMAMRNLKGLQERVEVLQQATSAKELLDIAVSLSAFTDKH